MAPALFQADALSLVDGPVWAPSNNRSFVETLPPALLQESYFNTQATYVDYTAYFHGVLRRWVNQADQLGITDNAGLLQYLGTRLEGYFTQTRKYLATFYPGQTLETYELLMDMNLVNGYYAYQTTHGFDRPIYRTLHLKTGDCSEIADLLLILIQAEGIQGQELGQVYNYPTAQGQFVSDHVVVYAGGLWLDGETNTAYALNLKNLEQISPTARLQTLFDTGRVFGFYNWYLQPQVRLQQVAGNEDGGIIAFYYQYYFAGIGQGTSKVYFIHPHWAEG